jgi:hypothetical protein
MLWALVPRQRSALFGALPFVLVGLPMLALALYPPTVFDALSYHLPYARAFAESGALVTVETLQLSVFPQLYEVIVTLPFLLVDDVAAEAVALLPAALIALLVAAWARRESPGSSVDSDAGAWAAALWLGNPLVVWMATQAYVDLALALFVVAGFLCLERWRARARLDPRSGLVLLGGLLLGAACGVKYLGLPFAGLGALYVLGCSARGGRARALGIFTLSVLVVAAPWYLRIAVETGNPVFPFLSSVFGGEPWSATLENEHGDPNDIMALVAGLTRRLLDEGPAWLLSLPVRVTWDRATFRHEAPLSPWTVVMAAAILWRSWRDRRSAWLLAGAAFYALALLYTTLQDLRYYLPLAATLAAGGAVALHRLPLPRRRTRLAQAAVISAFLFPGVFYGVYKVVELGPPPLGVAAREAFLGRWVVGFRALRELERQVGLGQTVYGYDFGPVRYYARGRYIGDRHGAYGWGGLPGMLEDPARLRAQLVTWGVDHLMIPPASGRVLRESACFQLRYQDEEALVLSVKRAQGPLFPCLEALPP